mmetsp:Transcript_34598/g.85801  ORF Transcript_34598/g.85801 Transcript_34598/m.85801 type:complete len:108 (-) Transcript_34598:327-650(-)
MYDMNCIYTSRPLIKKDDSRVADRRAGEREVKWREASMGGRHSGGVDRRSVGRSAGLSVVWRAMVWRRQGCHDTHHTTQGGMMRCTRQPSRVWPVTILPYASLVTPL